MLETLFYFVLSMSIQGSVIIIFILLIRNIRQFPKEFIYKFWFVAFARMMIPLAISSKYSLFNYTGSLIKKLIFITEEITIFAQLPISLYASNSLGFAYSFAPLVYEKERLKIPFIIGTKVWLVGVLLILFVTIFLYVQTTRKLDGAVKIKTYIYRSPLIFTPTLKGVFHPKIIVPERFDLEGVQAKYVLAHEQVHMARLDNLWRLIAMLVVCIHWFNPLAWLMLYFYLKDMELSCDAIVIKKLGRKERKEYAETLVDLASETPLDMATTFGGSHVKKRVINVLTYKKISVIGMIISILFLLFLTLMLLTNPQV